jgi:hypothetical protein
MERQNDIEFLQLIYYIGVMDDKVDHYNKLLSYLKDNDIPYKKGMALGEYGICFDFIIPGGVIKFRGTCFKSKYSDKSERVMDQIESLRKYVPDHMKIYFYIPTTSDENLAIFKDMPCITTNKLEDIKYSDVYYYAEKSQYIKTLVSHLNENYERDLAKYKDKIIANRESVDKCLVIFNDEEMKRFESYNVKVMSVNEAFKTYKYLAHFNPKKKYPVLCLKSDMKHNINNKSLIDRVFHYLTTPMNVITLDHKKRHPVKVLEPVTKMCDSCEGIYFMKYMSKVDPKNCKHCSPEETSDEQ